MLEISKRFVRYVRIGRLGLAVWRFCNSAETPVTPVRPPLYVNRCKQPGGTYQTACLLFRHFMK